MVLGPASDGGYYLIGLKRPHRELFTQIEWEPKWYLAVRASALQKLDLRPRCFRNGMTSMILKRWAGFETN
jgi:Uncharacterized protein conserved in bacteria